MKYYDRDDGSVGNVSKIAVSFGDAFCVNDHSAAFKLWQEWSCDVQRTEKVVNDDSEDQLALPF